MPARTARSLWLAAAASLALTGAAVAQTGFSFERSPTTIYGPGTSRPQPLSPPVDVRRDNTDLPQARTMDRSVEPPPPGAFYDRTTGRFCTDVGANKVCR